MKTKLFVLKTVAAVMFAAMFITACNPFLHEEKEKEKEISYRPPNTSTLSAPTGLITTGATASSVSISWSSVFGATGYHVYRSSSSTGNYSRVGTSTLTTYKNTGLSSGTTYYYKVAAYDSTGTGSQSSYIYAATQSSSTFSITISGTPKTGQTLTAVTTGTGWTGDFMWGYADSGNANTYSLISSATGSTFTITSSYTGKYIRAFRYHPSGTWNKIDSSGKVIPGTSNFPSNFLGPVQ
jgi:hypothetical protein